MSEIICSDCLVAMAGMEPNSIDAIVTDPPYGLSFMGKDWDHGIPGQPFWAEAMRVAKPGAHLLAFGGTRTFHRLTCAIEDAGWEIRDCLGWLYGSGFPKSHNLKGDHEGWGTALKPAWEPIILARKPLDGTVAANVQKWGTGAVNVDGCRVGENPGYKYAADHNGTTFHGQQGERIKQSAEKKGSEFIESSKGRWPANIIHDGSDEVLELFPPSKSGAMLKPYKYTNTGNSLGKPTGETRQIHGPDSGSAARFFKICQFTEEEPCDVNTAELSSCQPSGYEDSAQGDALISDNQGVQLGSVESPHIPAYIGNSNTSIPPPDLVLFAESRENTGTTPTTRSRLKSSGCASRAITNSTHATGRSGQSRFVYCPKASRKEREMGCEGMEERQVDMTRLDPEAIGCNNPHNRGGRQARNHHPTVKPLALMRYLCRLVTPPNGLILDPFCGSGSTGIAAKAEGFRFIGIDNNEEYCEIARKRLAPA